MTNIKSQISSRKSQIRAGGGHGILSHQLKLVVFLTLPLTLTPDPSSCNFPDSQSNIFRFCNRRPRRLPHFMMDASQISGTDGAIPFWISSPKSLTR